MMSHRQKAKVLAARPYTLLVTLDETTNGEPIYVAYILELEGCLSQGNTREEALDNVKAAQVDFIQSLLEDDLPVPEPQTQSTFTTTVSTVAYTQQSWKIVRPQLQSQDIIRVTTPSLTS
jgi:predicted RNase H-like HicB family nuclease